MKAFFITLLFCYVSSVPQIELPTFSLSSIQVVKFPNTACTGTSARIGTCYTAEECSDRDGNADGSCANGYGVCCGVSIPCGGSSRENNSRMVMAQVTRPATQVCTHTILPLNNDICRIKLDFTTFNIAGPVVGTSVQAALLATTGGSIGSCTRDTFSVTNPGRFASPLICGVNTGQHIFVDASNSGNVAAFSFNDDSVTRTYDIRVIQFECGDTQAGTTGCLQYFTGPTGTIASFNFPMGLTTVAATVTHLNNQHYQACFRREIGRCAICYIPSVTIATTAANVAATQSSFGLSSDGNPADALAESETDAAKCNTDYVTIPFAFRGDQAFATATTVPLFDNGADVPADLKNRLCGRIFAADEDQTADNVYAAAATAISVCSVARPFRFNVDFDDFEDTVGTDANDDPNNDLGLAPGGIIGFSLDFTQLVC